MSGRVVLVGAGPGDPDLLTVRAVREIECAEVLLHDALIPPAILALARPDCERIDVGKRGDGTRGTSLDEIADLLVEKARAGHYVVRLKGGDPFVFGRGGEEASALVQARVPFEVVPGISSAFSVPAYAGIPVTDRRASSSVAVVTGHRAANRDINEADWEGLASSAETLVVLMGTRWLKEIAERVIAGGRAPETPAAVIESGATGRQRVITGTLATIAGNASQAELRAPTVIVIGEVARFHSELAWYEKRPLFQKRVLVLRAAEQSAELLQHLSAEGAVPLAIPLLAFEACQGVAAPAAPPDWVAFSSANAIRFTPRDWMADARIACIGAATERAARQAGLAVAVRPEGEAEPEALAAAMGSADSLRGARVLLPRVVGGRDRLAQLLEAAGARVERREVYRNVTPEGAAERLRRALADGVEALLLSSPSTVQRLQCALGAAGLSELTRSSALVCIGATTERALRAAGVETGIVAREASSRGLVDALVRHFSGESHAFSD